MWVALVTTGFVGLWGLGLAILRSDRRGARSESPSGSPLSRCSSRWVRALRCTCTDCGPCNGFHVFYGIVVAVTFSLAYVYRAQLARKPALSYGLLAACSSWVSACGPGPTSADRRSLGCRTRMGKEPLVLNGKRLVITGVLTDGSIAWHTARIAQEQGAEIVLTGFGRAIRLTERSAKRLPTLRRYSSSTSTIRTTWMRWSPTSRERWGAVDGALHAIAFAPEDALGGNFLNTPAESASTAFLTSAFSYKTLAVGPSAPDASRRAEGRL